jgi:hypothetical protein
MSRLSLDFWALFTGCGAQFAGDRFQPAFRSVQERLMLGMSTTSIHRSAPVSISVNCPPDGTFALYPDEQSPRLGLAS